jgi:hypothetical protein
MQTILRTLVFVLVALLAGCASPSYYQAASESERFFGYTDRQVDGPLFRVTFVAGPVANLDQTYAFTIYRAAELAHSKGATHFEVLEGPVNKDAIERFIGKATANNSRAFDSKELELLSAPLPAPPTTSHMQSVRYYTPNYIYAPIQPPPPPVQISLLVRLLNAPSLDPARGFDVSDLLARLGVKIIRPPVKTI